MNSRSALARPLVALLLLAAILRLPLVFWPNVYAPDEIFQYLEPAWRILGHDSIISWEWRFGIRGWLTPAMLAAPVWLGDRLVPGGMGGFVAPRLLAAVESLSIVASAFGFGARVSRLHAIVAGLVAAIWFEFVYFAPHTLGEPLATAAILPAALLLTHPTPSSRRLAIGGALLALAFVFRFQYAPAMAVIVFYACWRNWARLPPIVFGGVLVLIVAGAVDAINGATPFGWLVENVRQNLVRNRAADFGMHPATDYLANFLLMWSAPVALLLWAIWRGWRHAPLLLWTAIANLAVHSAIGHKEHRFVFLSVATLIILAALGSADWIERLRLHPAWRRWALPLIVGGWVVVSATLACTGVMPERWTRGTGAARLAADVRNDSALCGLALYEMPYLLLVGRERLAGKKPIYALTLTDPMTRDGASATAQRVQAAFNRIIARRDNSPGLPASFAPGTCADVAGEPVCLFARPGGCDPTAAASFAINDVLQRIDR